jgi:hypothetical protein
VQINHHRLRRRAIVAFVADCSDAVVKQDAR